MSQAQQNPTLVPDVRSTSVIVRDKVSEELGSPSSAGFPLATLHEVNERCIELLVNAARADTAGSFPLVQHIRETLRASRPETRRLAAQRAFLLLDLEFRNLQWWRALRANPEKHWRTPSWRGSFPRRSAIPLTRATLMLAWYGIQSDISTACVLLGMTKNVAELIAAIPLSEIDRMADRGFRYLQPRWHDHPTLWRELLTPPASSGTADRVDVHGLQLLTGELLMISA
jgi:hypothetical protein